MTSKERVRAAMQRVRPDRVPAAFEAVRTVNEKLIRNGGYILMASQGFEGDVPIENIEAVYRTPRIIR